MPNVILPGDGMRRSDPDLSSSRRGFLAKCGWAAGAALSPSFAAPQEPAAELRNSAVLHLSPGTPQHFFDDSLLANKRRVVRRWLPTYINHDPVITPDRPWEEGTAKMQGSILAAPDGGYRMYYSGGGRVLVAFSPDGLEWQKPELNICPWNGRPSNILLQTGSWSIASASVIRDEQDSQHPYKLTSYQHPDKKKSGGLYSYQSSDGLYWDPIPGPHFQMGDAHTMMDSRSGGKFVGYIRREGMFQTVGVRSIFRTESDNLLDWSDPKLVLAPDLQDEPDVEFYSMSAFRRGGWFLGLLQYWRSDQDVLDIQLCFSRDGKIWQRPEPRMSFIAPTYDWNSNATECAHNGPLYLNEEMAFYFSGTSTAHHSTTTHRKDAVIGLASLEVDRFCAIEGTTSLGWVDTVPLSWPGGNLVVNADTRESFTSHPTMTNGELSVEVLDESGHPLAEWSGANKALFHGNTHSRGKIGDGTVRWPKDRGLKEFAGRVIRLRFGLRHARLFTFEAGDASA